MPEQGIHSRRGVPTQTLNRNEALWAALSRSSRRTGAATSHIRGTYFLWHALGERLHRLSDPEGSKGRRRRAHEGVRARPERPTARSSFGENPLRRHDVRKLIAPEVL